MSKIIEIDGKKLHTIKAATELVAYSSDYITRLAREQKIVASLIGRQWYIDIESLKHYESLKSLEQTIRKQKLSEERKQERALHDELIEQRQRRHLTQRRKALTAKVMVASAVVAGVWSGYLFETVFPQLRNPGTQVASTPSASSLSLLATDVSPEPVTVTTLPSVDRQTQYTPVFSTVPDQVQSFASSTQGVLLLPSRLSEGELLELQDLFSDRIVVRIDDSGQKFVSQVNEHSEIIGAEIPVITIPLNQATP